MIRNAFRKLVISCSIIIQTINVCSAQTACKSGLNIQSSKWNVSAQEPLFGQSNKSAGNDERSLNLSRSSLDINRRTDAIAVLDDNNGRIIVFNRSNTSTIFNIVLSSSNVTQTATTPYRPASIAYSPNGSLYISDGWTKKIFRLKSRLEFGMNVTELSISAAFGAQVFSSAAGGLCIDTFDERIYITLGNRILRCEDGSQNVTVYIGDGTPGNANYQLNAPTSIVMDSNRTLFVNDVGNRRIQVFKFNFTNGTTLPVNVYDSIALSLHLPDILVITTRTAIHLFNLTDNVTTCAIGCPNTKLTNAHNAVIDSDGNIIVSESNVVLLYSMDQQCPEVTTQLTTPAQGPPSSFTPVYNCSTGWFGMNCSFSEDMCNISEPCSNSGQCIANQSIDRGYHCECPTGFDGVYCQNDRRLCKPWTCLGRGNCSNNSRSEPGCRCYAGYEGERCEKIAHNCANVTCQNSGVCFEQRSSYTCQCLAGFRGRHCESLETGALVRGYVTKSLGYIAVLMLVGLASFVIIMDVLKYGFNIDPVAVERDRARKKRKAELQKKGGKPKVVYRFRYVN